MKEKLQLQYKTLLSEKDGMRDTIEQKDVEYDTLNERSKTYEL